ncbi:hypothetical protein N658DRAFT_344446 [Parathielavia hyrcaniae]|uniref:Uncharacterized protein n=1 Tax=Parathielavia hyrcaniae TaxID=113614 RepID=A0AAN6T3A2_9PEZI|nr:hypothetical protein N658DRAFT_344446 [Parathielavia hyrcaniae]
MGKALYRDSVDCYLWILLSCIRTCTVAREWHFVGCARASRQPWGQPATHSNPGSRPRPAPRWARRRFDAPSHDSHPLPSLPFPVLRLRLPHPHFTSTFPLFHLQPGSVGYVWCATLRGFLLFCLRIVKSIVGSSHVQSWIRASPRAVPLAHT